MKLKNAIVFITGAARRVGSQLALDLAQQKARVIIHYNKSEQEALDLQAEFRSLKYPKLQMLQADLADNAAIQDLAERAWKIYGHIDVLIHNASTFYPTPLGQVTEAEWNDLFDINAKAPFFLSQSIGLNMKKRGQGKIISIADWSYERPEKRYIPYCASKAALVALTQGLARELAPEVQCNILAPGPIMWPEDIGEKIIEALAK